ELDNARSALIARRKSGEGLRGEYRHQDSATLASDMKATVLDCLSLTAEVIDIKSGHVKSKTPQVPVPVSVEMTLNAGVWKVAHISTGTQSCAPASKLPGHSALPTRTTGR